MVNNPAPASLLASLSGDRPIPGSSAQGKRARVRYRIKKRDVANMTAQLAIMTQAGVDVTSSLGSMVRQCKQPALQEILGNVHESVLGGTQFPNR